MARILGDYLAAQKLTLTELIHSSWALEKLESAGTFYQHAIQKVAVAQASESESSVTQIVKRLDGLCTSAIHRVYKDERRGVFPLLEAGQFGSFAERIASSPEGRYALNGALAKYLPHGGRRDATTACSGDGNCLRKDRAARCLTGSTHWSRRC
jgi:hypothetical protein